MFGTIDWPNIFATLCGTVIGGLIAVFVARRQIDPGKVRVGGTQENEKALKRRLEESSKGVQMSHQWIRLSLPNERLTPAGLSLIPKVREFRRRVALGDQSAPPYARWIVLVTGRQKHLHDKKQGHQHQIQQPLITLPDNILVE